MPEDVAYVKLPSVQLLWVEGRFQVRSAHLSVPFNELIELRAGIIRTIVAGFRPDVWLVDHNPSGFYHELDLGLDAYRGLCPEGSLVLGMRGVAFGRKDTDDYFKRFERYLRELYDKILVYVDPVILDLKNRYSLLPEISRKMLYTGYISRTSTRPRERKCRQERDTIKVVAATGSGAIGYSVLVVVLKAIALAERQDWNVTIVTGPYMEGSQVDDLRRRIATLPDPARVELQQFLPDLPHFMTTADLFIGRGGYNTLVDIVSAGCPSIIIPYETDMSDQLEHASLFARHGHVSILRERHLTPENLSRMIRQTLSSFPPKTTIEIDLEGADRAAAYILELAYRKETLIKLE